MSPEPTPPTICAETSRVGRTRNLSSIVVLVLILSVSMGSLFYMAYPSQQVFGSTTETFSLTGVLTNPESYVGYNGYTQTAETINSTACSDGCYYWDLYPVYSTTTFEVPVSVWMTSWTTFQVTDYSYSTSHWTNTVPPYFYLGSSENQFPTVVALIAVSLIGVLSFLLVMARRGPKIEGTNVARSRSQFKFCRECGAKLPHDSVFCEECGTNLV